MDPELNAYTKIFEGIAKMFTLPVGEVKALNVKAPIVVTKDTPTPAEYDASHEQAETSDGAKIGLQIYRPKQANGALPLVLVMHGGGWVIGGHGTEEGLTRSVCVRNGCVVVSVDYRM